MPPPRCGFGPTATPDLTGRGSLRFWATNLANLTNFTNVTNLTNAF